MRKESSKKEQSTKKFGMIIGNVPVKFGKDA